MIKFYKDMLLKPNFSSFVAIFIFGFLILFGIDYLEFGFKIKLIDKILIDLIYVFSVEIWLFLLCLIIFRRFFIPISYLLLLVFTIFFISEAFLLLKFNTEFNSFILDAIIHTNPNEALEFGKFFLDEKIFLIISLAFLILFCCFKIKPRKFNQKFYIVFLILFLSSSVFTIAKTALRYFKNDPNYLVRINKSPIFRLFYVNLSYFTSEDNKNDLQTFLKFYQENYDKNLNSNLPIQEENLPENVILIIGESLQRNYMSLYSYEIDTTPRLKSLQTSGNLIAFSDVISPFTATNPTLQRLLNFSNYESQKPWYDSLNIIDLFRLMDYQTAWFSNQEKFGSYASAAASVAARADVSKFSHYSQKGAAIYDEILLKMFEELKTKKNFYVFHLLGSHSSYDARYPSEFGKFDYIDLDLPLDNKQKIVLKRYLNSIFYNDFIISQIFEIFKSKDAIIIYLSDHGEALYEQNNLVGHGGVVSRFVCEIPLIFIASDEFISRRPDLWQGLKNAKNKPLMSDDLIHSIADLMKFYPLEFDASRSVLRDEFNAGRKRFVAGKDYENLRSVKAYER